MRAWLISNQRETPVSVPILACSCAIVIVGLEGSKDSSRSFLLGFEHRHRERSDAIQVA